MSGRLSTAPTGRDAFLAAGGSRLGSKPRLMEMRQAEGIDIDEEADWEMAWSLAQGHPDFR